MTMSPIILRWLFFGFIFGLCFPLGALLIDFTINDMSFSWQSIQGAHSKNFLHWIIDVAPIVLGLMGLFIGIQQHRLNKYTENLEVQVDKRTHQLLQNQQKLTESIQLLEEANIINESVLDTAADAIININRLGVVSQFNQSAEKLFGYSSKEMLGNNISILMSDEHALNHSKYIIEFLHNSLNKQPDLDREVLARHKDGRFIAIQISISDTGIDGEKRFTGIRDLTEVNATKEVLLQHEEQLEQLVNERTKELEEANNQLKMLSETDSLTQIANRRVYEHRLVLEIAAAKRTTLPLALIMIDIDYFKRYNDSYGHDAGDQTIIRVAKAIRDTLPRKTDLAARYGGEEFVVLMPSTNSQGAYQVAEQIRINVKALGIKHHGETVLKS
jgi:diguanylate cyclase (GGDEF)-like protein/PAS domain S-box-containing protein